VVLKGGVQIGLGGMAGVSRFREDAEIGQIKLPRHLRHFRDVRRAPPAHKRGMRESGGQEGGLDGQIEEEQR